MNDINYSPSNEGEVLNRDKQIFDQSYDLIKKSMKDVIQEIVINLDDGSSHIIYIHNIEIEKDGKVSIDFSTPSEEYKSSLYPHIEKCIKIQIDNIYKNKPGFLKRLFW